VKTPTKAGQRPSIQLHFNRAFSLVELLVVIAVIAIIAAIAIPNIANITGSATVAKNQRNAQNIASVASAARAAGYTNGWADKAAAAAALCSSNGVTVTNGNNIMTFRIDALSGAEQTNALTFLRDDGTNVYYQPSTN